MFDPPASLPELVEQDERDEALREVAKPLESTGEGPRSHDLVPDRHRGATVLLPRARRAGIEALIARPKRKIGARGKLANRGGLVSAQCVGTVMMCAPIAAINSCVRIASRWKNITANAFSSKPCRIRPQSWRRRDSKKPWS
eukprot:6886641-Pyramimonas_sp.AAC.1